VTSPEAASVVERINAELNYDGVSTWEDICVKSADVRALLAVVEAAKYVSSETWCRVRSEGSAKILSDALDALYTPDSAEERE